jgi:hypothetical protein
MIGCAASTGLPECDERVRAAAAACGQRRGQGGGDGGAAPPDRGPAAATGHDPDAVLPWRPGVPGRFAAPAPARSACPVPAAGAPGDGAALTGACWAAAMRPGPAPGARAGRAPCAPSACWCCALHEKVPAGATVVFTANCSSSASGPPPPPCGRSSGRPGSARRPSALRPPGPTSSVPGLRPCSPASSSRPPAARLARVRAVLQRRRPHQGIANARPLHALPPPIPDPSTATRLQIRRRDRLGGILHEYRYAALPAWTRFSASTT